MRKFLGIFFLLFILLLPSIASTNFGKKGVEHLLQKRFSFPISIESLSLHWLSGQKATGFSTYTPASPFTLTAREVCLPSPLPKCLLSAQNEIQLKGGSLFYEKKQWIDQIDGSISQEGDKIHLALTSSITRGSFNGTIANGILTLNDPLEISTSLPLEKGKIPVTLHIDPLGFSCPLTSSNLRELNAPKVHLSCAPITYKPAKGLRLAFKLVGKGSLKKKCTFEVSPIDFSINKGVVTLPPTAISYEGTSFTTRGTIDLVTDQVDLLLEIPGDFLGALFGTAWLTEDFALKFPLRGKIGEISLEEELYRFLVENI